MRTLLRIFAMTVLATTTTTACASDDATAPDTTIAIAINQSLTGETTSAGTFTLSGGRQDIGTTTEVLTFGGPLSVSPVPLTYKRTLVGAKGTMVLTGSAQLTFTSAAAATLSGTWTVESGTGAYAALRASGTISGNANFGVTPPTASVFYSGIARER